MASAAAGTSTAGALGTTATTPATGTGSNSTDYQKSDGSKEYGVNHITETSKVAPGKVERLSVAVVLDGSAKPAPDAEKVKQVVGAALGLVRMRGDNIVVDTMRFDGANAAAGKGGKSGGGASAGGAAVAGGTGTIVDFHVLPNTPQGSWAYGEGVTHHCAFEVDDLDVQKVVKFHLEGLGFTDVSDVKDRGYFDSVYVRTPGGALFEACVSKPEGFLVDEAYAELGKSFQVPPVFANRAKEIIEYLEPLRRARSAGAAGGDQSLLVTASSSSAKRSRAAARRVGTCSLGTPPGGGS